MSRAIDWRDTALAGNYAEAESAMLAATDRGEGYFPDCEVRGSFYENWGDLLSGEEQIAKYREALNYWQMNAAQATSGGEGTARMIDVYRVAKKIDGKRVINMKDAVIVSAVRTAVGKAPKGTLRNTRPDDLGAAAIKEAVARAGVDTSLIDDVIMGCAFPEAEQGMNVARTAMIAAGLPVETSAMTVNRYCSSGLQTIALAADRIATGGADCIVAGGLETMSMIPMGGNVVRPNPAIVETYPDYYLNMGLTAENLARKYEITREQADEFSLASHQKAAAAIASGKFKDEIVPMNVHVDEFDEKGRVRRKEVVFDTDEGPRFDSTIEGLAKLKPVFHIKGTVTAGNSSQMSDGAAAAVVMSMDKANELGLKPLARFVSFATAGCLPEEMGIGPVYAIPKALKLAGLTMDQIDLFELNEAFAAQGLSVVKVLGMDPAKVNVNGGAVALGHPLGCTGAKLTATILQELKRTGKRYGMVTMCVGGGMGAAGIFERLD